MSIKGYSHATHTRRATIAELRAESDEHTRNQQGQQRRFERKHRAEYGLKGDRLRNDTDEEETRHVASAPASVRRAHEELGEDARHACERRRDEGKIKQGVEAIDFDAVNFRRVAACRGCEEGQISGALHS
jgi:hypothetical protein